MLDRLISMLLLWSMEGCFAWYVAHAYTDVVNAKLGAVAKALAVINN